MKGITVICLLVIQIKSTEHFWMMVIAGVSSLFFKWAFSGNWYIILAALLASGIGVIKTEGRRRKAGLEPEDDGGNE